MNPLIRNFVLVIKQWAKFEQVCGATIRHLSTYSFTLMAIFFLQVHPGLHPNYRLPCISTASFDIAADPGDGTDPQGIRWDMDLQLSQVVWDFFHFYTNEYNWSEEVVSVRLGRRVSRYDPEVSQLAGHVAPRLHIEDPFLLERNLNCVLGSEQEEYLQDRMRSTFASLASWRMPPAFVMKQPKPLRQQAAPFPAAAPKHEAPRLPQAPRPVQSQSPTGPRAFLQGLFGLGSGSRDDRSTMDNGMQPSLTYAPPLPPQHAPQPPLPPPTQPPHQSKEQRGDDGDREGQLLMTLARGIEALLTQQQAGKGDRPETVKPGISELPVLPEYEPATGSIDLLHWITHIGPIMEDLSDTSAAWWHATMKDALQWYSQYSTATPLQK
eukprot:s1080_g11.t1